MGFRFLNANKQIYLSYTKSYQIKSMAQKYYLLVQYANRLICIFININENIRIVRKSQKKSGMNLQNYLHEIISQLLITTEY